MIIHKGFHHYTGGIAVKRRHAFSKTNVLPTQCTIVFAPLFEGRGLAAGESEYSVSASASAYDSRARCIQSGGRQS